MVRACPRLHNRQGHQRHQVNVEELGIRNGASNRVKERAGHQLDHGVEFDELECLERRSHGCLSFDKKCDDTPYVLDFAREGGRN